MKIICKNCGKELNNAQKFCDECGTEVSIINETLKKQDNKEMKSGGDPTLQPNIIEKDNYYNSFNYDETNTNTKLDNLYQRGMDIIISSSILYSAPFLMAGKHIIDQFELLEEHTAETLSSDLIKNIPLEQFLADFYKYSNAFVERVTQYFSDIIRKQTQRSDIKEKTSEYISNEIRKESFKKFDEVFSKYSLTMQELGVQLESVSTIKSAVQGTLLGGGLQLMGSRGKSSGAGMVAGALIGAALAEAEKIQIRQTLLRTAFDGIKETIETLPICNQKLMDQYSSYIFGSNIDFSERDKQIDRGKQVLDEIKKHCTVTMDNIVSGNSFWTTYILKITKINKGKKFTDFYGQGCLGTIVLMVVLGIIGLEDATVYGIGFFSYGIVMLLFYLKYQVFDKKKHILNEKEKFVYDVQSRKSDYQQLEKSIKVLTKYKDLLASKAL